MSINILLPQKTCDNGALAVESFGQNSTRKPFEDISKRFIFEFSKKILRSKKWRDYPDVIAAANWFRPKKVLELEKIFFSLSSDRVKRPIGTIFHIAPSNVDTIFLYSWLLSLLVGNKNIVKISSKSSSFTELIVSTIEEVIFEDKEYKNILPTNVLLTYDNQKTFNDYFSSICDARVVWGGDNTVDILRNSPLKPSAREITFPDKFSFGIISSSDYLNSDEDKKQMLITNFNKDISLFSQQACSSPRILFWIGKPEINFEAKENFWQRIEALTKNDNDLGAGEVMDRFVAASKLAALSEKPILAKNINSKIISRAHIDHRMLKASEVKDLHSGNLFIIESEANSLNELNKWIDSKTQTITAFGFTSKILQSFLTSLNDPFVERIVPFGESLNFDYIWDGQNFLNSFSKITTVRSDL